ncbi:AraC family transcriptional regulator [Primorskyibacter sp. 2E107]|uniref:AraC family transcriptional regulator n=1 Tax=Primorskyibacter sp. 2E107 TaxID=3403458 RepID=UPI003AF82846
MRDDGRDAGVEARVRRVIRYIFDNPAGDLSLDALADVAAMSRFHWSRVFHAMTGETCAGAVRRIRAHRASIWLVQSDMPEAVIAARCGYDNAQSFARLFKAQTGMTPLEFRRMGRPETDILPFRQGNKDMSPFDVRDLPDQRLAGLPHTGPYYEIGRAFDQIGAVFSANSLWPQSRGLVGLYFDSPEDVEEAHLRSFAGILVGEEFEMPAGLEDYVIPGGRHLVSTYKGPYAGLKQAWDDTYISALPQCGSVPADRPPFETYLNSPLDTKPEALLTEICVPLAD